MVFGEDRDLDVVSAEGVVHRARVSVATRPPWWLRLAFGGREYAAEADDLFECLRMVRAELEPEGWRICCLGARPDVFPSGMSSQMSGGRKAYRHARERRPTRDDLVDILDPADCAEVATLAEQELVMRRLRG
jgi:hypothetical protein